MIDKKIVDKIAEIIQQGCNNEARCIDCKCYEMTLPQKGKCKEYYIAERIYEYLLLGDDYDE